MPIIEWNDSFKLGVDQFDEHHQHLVGLINRTYDDFTSGASNDRVGAVLDELIDYACYHFAAEEHWMKENGYPRISEHVQQHDRFSRRIVEIQKDFIGGTSNLLLEVLTFLNNWLLDHILKTDADYVKFKDTQGTDQGIILKL